MALNPTRGGAPEAQKGKRCLHLQPNPTANRRGFRPPSSTATEPSASSTSTSPPPARARCRWRSPRPACATPTCTSPPEPGTSRRRWCWATKAPAWSPPSAPASTTSNPATTWCSAGYPAAANAAPARPAGRPSARWSASVVATGGTLYDGTTRLSNERGQIHHYLGVSSYAEQVVVPRSGAIKVRKDAPSGRHRSSWAAPSPPVSARCEIPPACNPVPPSR